MTYPAFYLLRHGQTKWNIAGRLQGKLDSSLTETGRVQAQQQGSLLTPIFEQFPDIPVISSPQGRALTTAQIALKKRGNGVIADERLREISAGAWDGAYLDTIEQTHGHLYQQSRNSFELMFLAPDGEGEEAVLKRCRDFLNQQRKPTILITHGATLCVLRGILREMAFDEMLDLSHEQGCIYAIENGEETILR
jgi:broad specificity phosphatase PhoE